MPAIKLASRWEFRKMLELPNLCLIALAFFYGLNLFPMIFESFTSDRIWASNPPESFYMVRMIGEVAKAAGLETVAEYVESAAALRLLARYGIDYAQGYYIGRAVAQPLEAVLELDSMVTQDRR